MQFSGVSSGSLTIVICDSGEVFWFCLVLIFVACNEVLLRVWYLGFVVVCCFFMFVVCFSAVWPVLADFMLFFFRGWCVFEERFERQVWMFP